MSFYLKNVVLVCEFGYTVFCGRVGDRRPLRIKCRILNEVGEEGGNIEDTYQYF
jgi:hypothetical protein